MSSAQIGRMGKAQRAQHSRNVTEMGTVDNLCPSYEAELLITIPPAGILLTPEQGEVFSYLVRYRLLR